jgi:hypothetical protein
MVHDTPHSSLAKAGFFSNIEWTYGCCYYGMEALYLFSLQVAKTFVISGKEMNLRWGKYLVDSFCEYQSVTYLVSRKNQVKLCKRNCTRKSHIKMDSYVQSQILLNIITSLTKIIWYVNTSVFMLYSLGPIVICSLSKLHRPFENVLNVKIQVDLRSDDRKQNIVLNIIDFMTNRYERSVHCLVLK